MEALTHKFCELCLILSEKQFHFSMDESKFTLKIQQES